ncbi:hypothetical protein BDF21DRAFT_405891 [Thamnidium elegans]|nr:hypothetical protein BDF21DRAFT_405891 [Thamnidium elegans]
MSHSRHSYSTKERRRSRSPYSRSREEQKSYKRYDSRRSDDRRSDDRRRDDGRRRREDYNNNDRRHEEPQLEPNINVVLRNLPDNAREVDIENKLIQMEASIDNVSLIKDRDTGESRKFAFIRFTSVGHAIQFVEKFRTFDMNSYRVRVDYCKKNKQEEEKDEWRCSKCGNFNVVTRRSCTECKYSYISSSNEIRTNETETIEINDGTKDISDIPSNMLLLRQLDHLTTEESIFEAVSSLEGVYRTLLIRDKLTRMSCEFAFVEFIDVQSAAVALEYARELLTIDGRKVLVSYTNPESFLPVYGQSEWSIPVVDGRVAYWDKSSYASEYSLAIEQEKKKKEEELKKREEELKKAREEESKKATKVKESLDDDLSAFYAEMGDFDTDTNSNSDIFSVPKLK